MHPWLCRALLQICQKGELELVRIRENDITQCQDDDGLVDRGVPVCTTCTFYWHNVVMPKRPLYIWSSSSRLFIKYKARLTRWALLVWTSRSVRLSLNVTLNLSAFLWKLPKLFQSDRINSEESRWAFKYPVRSRRMKNFPSKFHSKYFYCAKISFDCVYICHFAQSAARVQAVSQPHIPDVFFSFYDTLSYHLIIFQSSSDYLHKFKAMPDAVILLHGETRYRQPTKWFQ